MKTLDRRGFLLGVGGLTAGMTAATWTGCTSGSNKPKPSLRPSSDPLFPKDGFTERIATIATSGGDREVTYRHYSAIPYVTRPVDATYHSLDVSVPTRIAGQDIDAVGAPILLDIPVVDYLSAAVGQGGSGNSDLALAAGCVVVRPGVRGRDQQDPAGRYVGKAPAAIVDLKAVVRFLRHNRDTLPGNTEQIIATGAGAAGGLSALLGASGDVTDYDTHFAEIGAARAPDSIFAAACYCPITDLEHADPAYEWLYGPLPTPTGAVDQNLSALLATQYAAYQAGLNLRGLKNFGVLTGENLGDYLLRTHLQPAATTHIALLPEAERAAYLTRNPWLSWTDEKATFTIDGFRGHLATRVKPLPAFDRLDVSSSANILFGDETTNARHFTRFGLRRDDSPDADLTQTLPLMNPLHFLVNKNTGRANNWWFRIGTSDTDTPLTVVANLAAAAYALGDKVDIAMYWDKGHGANDDAPAFIAWLQDLTGYRL